MAMRPTNEAAPRAGFSPGTWENWRCQGKGPKFHKLGGKILYDDRDVDEWLAANRFSSTAEAQAA